MTERIAPRAPAEDFGVFASPPMPEWGELARSNRQLLQDRVLEIGGVGAAELRRRARADFLDCARASGCGSEKESDALIEAPWFMTGHQPELYHPGVWAKNLAVAAVARAQQGLGGNLVADTDQIKSSAIRVISGSEESPRIVGVAFDSIEDGPPFETWQVRNEDFFRSFAERVRKVGNRMPADPLLDTFWPKACAVESPWGAARFTIARNAIEKAWGFGLVESPMGQWSETESVTRLFLAILSDLPRFHAIHHEKLTAYRTQRKIHSRNHPVADLGRDEDWWEAPLWIWRDTAPLRRKLWVRRSSEAAGLDLRIEGETKPLGAITLAPGRIDGNAIAMWRDLAVQGVRIRPRALVTTALCRILLADLFVHGIGGAIYDVLGDEIFGEFFGMRMPRYAILTATLRLADFPPSRARAEREDRIRESRWLRWQAERVHAGDSRLAELFERKRVWLSHPHENRSDRRLRATQLRRVNREIAKVLDAEIRAMDESIDRVSQQTVSESIVRSREFSILIHSETRLKRLVEKIGEMAATGSSKPDQVR